MGIIVLLEFVVADAPKTLGPAGSFRFFNYVKETKETETEKNLCSITVKNVVACADMAKQQDLIQEETNLCDNLQVINQTSC